MRLLTYQAKRFDWHPILKNSCLRPIKNPGGSVRNCVVVWLHVEQADQTDEGRIFRHVLNVKWIANKRKMGKIVLHSFAVGGEDFIT